MRFAILFLVAVPFLAVSCGGSSDPKQLTSDGSTALGSDDYAGALAAYEKALEVIGDDVSHPQYFTAALGCVEARTLGDPKGSVEGLKALATKLPDQVTAREYGQIAGVLGKNEHLTEAVAVVGLGLEAYPGAESLTKQRTLLGARLEKLLAAGDASGEESEALKALQGLGYVGGD